MPFRSAKNFLITFSDGPLLFSISLVTELLEAIALLFGDDVIVVEFFENRLTYPNYTNHLYTSNKYPVSNKNRRVI